jgi:hypothetical protein
MPQNSLFNLKIMKLFLLNTMENKKSRKIGLTILGFFKKFLQFRKASMKKKKENIKQYWAGFSPGGPVTQGKRGAPTPARETLQKGPCLLEYPDRVQGTI